MSKKVVWQAPKISSSKRAGKYRTMREAVKKSEDLRREQEAAMEYLQKALPAMTELLRMRMSGGTPLIVMRPLQYRTSVLNKSEEDDGFYANPQPQQVGFVDRIKTIMPGTQLLFKGMDSVLREFIFEDALGEEHAINFDDKNILMTQTDVFETVRKLFEAEGE